LAKKSELVNGIKDRK